MNILQVFPGKVWGGAEQYILDLGAALTALGHNVSYVSTDAPAVTSRLKGAVPFVSVSHFSRLRMSAAEKRALTDLLKDAGIVHIHDIRFLSPLRRLIKNSGSNARLVLTRHIARPSRTMPWRRGGFRDLHRMIFVSRLAMNLWRGTNAWMPADKCCVIHNSIPGGVTPAESPSLRETFGISPTAPIIMFTGRVRKSKGCGVIVEALSKLRDCDWDMVFVGTCKPESYRADLQALADRLGIGDRIHFAGFSRRVRSLIREADMGVAPSIVREACPLSPLEFMEAGKCIIATDNGAQPEFIDSGRTGLLVPPANADAVADALRKVLTQAGLREALAAAAREDFQKNRSYRAFVSNILEAYS